MVKQPLNNPGGSDTFRQMETKTRSVFNDVCLQSKEYGFSFKSSREFPKLCLHKEEGDGQKERGDVLEESSVSREGRWKRGEEQRATGERAPASQLRVNHCFYFSVRSREEGGRADGAAGLAMATGRRKLIIRLWL